MNAIKNKIRSREGASITFALLIFMVCAIISGVVIVAGSTAAGRMSQIAQSDQRYYAVTSAAGLLRDDIDGTTVTVSFKKKEGAYVEGSVSADTDDATANDTDDAKPIIADATCQYALMAAGVAPQVRTFALTVADSEGASNDTLACEIRENVMSDGRLIFEICSPTVSGAKYALQIIFNSKVSMSSVQAKDEDGEDMEIVTAVVEWKLSGAQKGKLAE